MSAFRGIATLAVLMIGVGGGAGGVEAQSDREARPLLAPPPSDGSLGHTVYRTSCESCHSGEESERAPRMVSLAGMTPRAIHAALTTGRMRRQSEDLSDEERVAVAEWITGDQLSETRLPDAAFCSSAPSGRAEIHSSGWGGGAGEHGYRGASAAGVTAADLDEMELAWAFAFPDAGQVRSKPAVVGDRVIVGSAYGEVYSLDLESGCVHWIFPADAAVRGGIAIGDGPGGVQAAFFADFRANAYAIDAATGEPLWKTSVADHADHSNTGTVAIHDGRVFVPVSTMEIASAGNPAYECCTASGGLVALSTESGEPLWEYWTISEEPREVGENELGTKIFAPSGAPVWSSPTVDAVRGLIYIGTGENYTHPTTETSDAIIALEMSSGAVRWSFQGHANDAWNLACGTPYPQNCPADTGPDFDFGMAPILVTRDDGSQILVAGQKSAMVWAFDPDADGELLWARKVGKGSALGGVHWGIASDGRRVYVPNSDSPLGLVRDPRTGELADPSGDEAPGMGVYALDLGAGEVLWKADPDPTACAGGRQGCMPFFSAAATVIDGAVLTGSLDGHMRAFSTEDGSLLWDIDTAREFETVNGVPGFGGAIDGPGPVVARGTVLINSGYDMFGEMPGNLLLAFRRPR